MIRILFAHNDQKLGEMYTPKIRNHFMVDSVYDGLSALRKIKTQAPHVIVSDYYLPLLSGISLLKFVRNNPEYHAIPFIFLTNHFDNSNALSFGANDWLEIKVSNPNSLLNRIHHHLRASKHGIQIHRA